ncbi:uncharacterized protein [Argopecten irradians]|uniref:uncharacterized protein isoform X2 n=1 Tax=Argopecten irradians TaxID=31199 RepID=UPI0037229479
MAEPSDENVDVLIRQNADEVFEFSSDEDAKRFISDKESRSSIKYKTQKATNIHDNTMGCDICWEDADNSTGFADNLASDSMPYIILGSEELTCTYNLPTESLSRKRKLDEDDHVYGMLEGCCSAQVKICKVIKFPQYKSSGTDLKSLLQRTILSEKLKKSFKNKSTIKKYKVFVRMPANEDHNHSLPSVPSKKVVNIPLNELLQSLPEKLVGGTIKEEPIELTEAEGNSEESMAQQEIEIETDESSPMKFSPAQELEPTSPRNIAASALASMNAMSTDTISTPEKLFVNVSSPNKSASVKSRTPSRLVWLERPGQTPGYVLINAPSEHKDQRQSYSSPSRQTHSTPSRQSHSTPSRMSNSTLPRMSYSTPSRQQTVQTPRLNIKQEIESAQVVQESQMPKVPWRGIEGSVAVSDTCFYTDDRDVMEECIKKYEEDTFSIFRCNKTTRITDLGLTEVKGLDNHRVRWCPLTDQWKSANYVPDNVPYLVLGRETRMCRFNRNPKLRKVKKKAWCALCNLSPEEQQSSTEECSCRLRQSVKTESRQPCPALISIHSIIRFIDFKASSRKKRVEMSKNLKCGLELIERLKMRIRQEKRIYVTVPSIEVHQNHPILNHSKVENPCCPCYRTGTCGTCPCKSTGCSRCNNNACRFRTAEGMYKPLRQSRKRAGSKKKKMVTPYAAKSIRNIRLNVDEPTLNEQLDREAELEIYQERATTFKIQQEILGMSLDQTRQALIQMLEDDPFHVESYVKPDHAPYHRVQIDTPPKWCSCTQCIEMNNSQMRMCCGQTPCLSFHPTFRSVCLRPDHLLVGLLDLGLPTDNFAEVGSFSNAQYRRQAYRCFILWQWNNLGKGDIEVPKPPSCVVARIRWRYPSIDNHLSDGFSAESDFEEGNR